MIISKDINPEKDFYYLGAIILEIISNPNISQFETLTVYNELKSRERISFNLYTLTLDWLYIIGAINKTKNGDIIRCF